MFDRKKYQKEYRQDEKHKEKHRIRAREWQRKSTKVNRLKCLIFYGGNPPKCSCCGETTIEFLSLDHINNDGNLHRKKINKYGNGIYPWIINNNFPNIFQVLCHNCNLSKGFYGECPHKKMRFSNPPKIVNEFSPSKSDYKL